MWGPEAPRGVHGNSGFPIFETASKVPDSKVFEYSEHQELEKSFFREGRWLQPKGGTPEATWQEMDPPDGHQWDGEWNVDVGRTSVDQEGWSYGTTKDKLSERRDSGVSNIWRDD